MHTLTVTEEEIMSSMPTSLQRKTGIGYSNIANLLSSGIGQGLRNIKLCLGVRGSEKGDVNSTMLTNLVAPFHRGETIDVNNITLLSKGNEIFEDCLSILAHLNPNCLESIDLKQIIANTVPSYNRNGSVDYQEWTRDESYDSIK